MAGSGDMMPRMVETVAEMGIGRNVFFTGFLRGPEVENAFRMADVYVMPSVSEPFGITPLEAIRNDVPVIISKQSGVAEVLTHALQVDFWDVDKLADRILAVLRHPSLRQALRANSRAELPNFSWDSAAQECAAVYRDVSHSMAHVA
jgi:glycosyltransferase involved in cell wall biosynthesis